MLFRRRFERCPVDANVGISISDEEGTKIYGDAKDISLIGLRFQSTKKWPIGAVIRVDYFIPGESEPIRFKGKVIWTKEDGEGSFATGVGDLHVESGYEERFINDFINHYSKRLIEKYYVSLDNMRNFKELMQKTLLETGSLKALEVE